MDLREKRTKRNITNAFLQLRKKMPLERISVKELSELAEISKATFYLHFKDIYELSEILQAEVIQNIIENIPHPEYITSNVSKFTEELFRAFHQQQSLIDILFADEQASTLPLQVEKYMIAYANKNFAKISDEYKMVLTYTIQGSYYVYRKYAKKYGINKLLTFITKSSESISNIL